MVKKYQITLVCSNGAYKPISCIIEADSSIIKKVGKENFIADLKIKGIRKICQKRYWSNKDLAKYGYTKIKIREYNKEKIEKENAERYKQIKREKGW